MFSSCVIEHVCCLEKKRIIIYKFATEFFLIWCKVHGEICSFNLEPCNWLPLRYIMNVRTLKQTLTILVGVMCLNSYLQQSDDMRNADREEIKDEWRLLYMTESTAEISHESLTKSLPPANLQEFGNTRY